MRPVAVWTFGTVYILAVLAATVALVWAADHRDNSPHPTHWAIGALIVMAPLGLFGAWWIGGAGVARHWSGSRAQFVVGAIGVAAVTAALAFGAQAVIADASTCGDDDCVRLVVPVALVCLLGAWGLPVGLWTMRRLRYPLPLMSAGLLAIGTTVVAGVAAVVQRTQQEDDYADLAIAVILLVWVLPAVIALAAVWALHSRPGGAAHRTIVGRIAAGYLAAVGIWLIALPFAAGVDADARPVLLAVSGGPGAVVLTFGLARLVAGVRTKGQAESMESATGGKTPGGSEHQDSA